MRFFCKFKCWNDFIGANMFPGEFKENFRVIFQFFLILPKQINHAFEINTSVVQVTNTQTRVIEVMLLLQK